jgi:hypothetical protein
MHSAKLSGVAMVPKTKELKTCYGAEEVKNRPSQFLKEPSHASGSSFRRESCSYLSLAHTQYSDPKPTPQPRPR